MEWQPLQPPCSLLCIDVLRWGYTKDQRISKIKRSPWWTVEILTWGAYTKGFESHAWKKWSGANVASFSCQISMNPTFYKVKMLGHIEEKFIFCNSIGVWGHGAKANLLVVVVACYRIMNSMFRSLGITPNQTCHEDDNPSSTFIRRHMSKNAIL